MKINNRVKVLAISGALLLGTTGLTLAAFTESGQVETTFTAGTLDLRFDDTAKGSPTAYQIDFSEGFDNLKPGDTVTKTLKVSNSGTINANVALAAPVIVNSAGTPTSALQDQLDVKIMDGDTSLYNVPLKDAAFANLDVASGNDKGHTLTFTVTMKSDATVAVAGQTITVTLPFTATQA